MSLSFDVDFQNLSANQNTNTIDKENIIKLRETLENWERRNIAYHGYRLDLRGANLQGFDMSAKKPDGSDAVFSGVLIDGARLDGADISGAQLTGARFNLNTLIAANLSDAKITGAFFENSCLLEGARFLRSDLTFALFSGAHLDGAVFTGATIDFATINDSSFEFATMIKVKARSTTFGDTKCFGSRFKNVDFRFSFFDNTQYIFNQKKQKLRAEQSAFCGLDFSFPISAGIDQKDVFGDDSVILSEKNQRPAHWPDWELPLIGNHAFETEWRKWQANPDTYIPPPKPE